MDAIQKTETVDKLLTTANLFRMRNNLAEATRYCQQALDVDPENAIGLDLMGDLLLAQGDLDAAMLNFKRAFNVTPRPVIEEKIARLALAIDAQKRSEFVDPATLSAEPARHRNPSLACGLSVLYPGLGQLYNGDFGKGLALFTINTLLLLIASAMLVPHLASLRYTLLGSARGMAGAPPLPGFLWLMLLIQVGIWLYGVIDAPLTATSINQGGRSRQRSGWEV